MTDLYSIHVDEIRKCCGLEAFLYLMFVKASAKFFLLISLLSTFVLIPTYVYAHEVDQNN